MTGLRPILPLACALALAAAPTLASNAGGGTPQPSALQQACFGNGIEPAKREQACNTLLADAREPAQRASLLRYRALARNMLGRTEEALADRREVARLVPDEPIATSELVAALIRADRAGEALETADAALARQPATAEVLYMRTAALTHLRRYDEAETTLDEIERIAPDLKADLDAARNEIRRQRTGD